MVCRFENIKFIPFSAKFSIDQHGFKLNSSFDFHLKLTDILFTIFQHHFKINEKA